MLLGSVLGAFRHTTACCGAEGGDFVICRAPTKSLGVKVVRLRDSSTQRGPSAASEVQAIRNSVNVEFGDLRTHSPSLGKDLRISICDALRCLTRSS